jgi:hypothetical protein
MRKGWLFSILLVGGVAAAQPLPTPAPAGDAAALDEAKRHFTQGVALYNDGNFNAALAEFDAANKAHKSPGFLYNIGLTQKALFRYSESIDSLTRYLDEAQREPGKPLSSERVNEVKQLINEMKALLADVALGVDPDGAQVIVDGRVFGNSPLSGMRLAAGHHVLELSADGYKPARREIDLTAGAPLALTIKLEAIPKSGKVHITASVKNAMVRVDGKGVGIAPVDLELPIGGHSLEVTSEGYRPTVAELVIAGGQTRDVPVILEKPVVKFHLYEKWWFWTLTVVVLGGIATGIAIPLASGTAPPVIGTLAPGTGKVN